MAKAGDGVAASANPTTPAKTYIDPDPGRWLGKESVGTGWCVPLVQKATGAPLTSEWRAGASVFGNPKIKPGTAIAVFDKDGRYGNHTDGTSHAAIFLSQDAGGIHVIDQFNTVKDGKITEHRAPTKRYINTSSKSKNKVDNPGNYNVIISK